MGHIILYYIKKRHLSDCPCLCEINILCYTCSYTFATKGCDNQLFKRTTAKILLSRLLITLQNALCAYSMMLMEGKLTHFLETALIFCKICFSLLFQIFKYTEQLGFCFVLMLQSCLSTYTT